jgi:hypothetical protein
VDLVNKHGSGHHLCNTLLDVSLDNPVDLASKLISNFCAAGLYEGAHIMS